MENKNIIKYVCSQLLDIIKNPLVIIEKFKFTPLFRWIPDKLYLSIMYKAHYGKKINWEETKLFSEKLQWLKLYDRNHLYTKLVDKYLIREYIESKIGKEYLIPLVGGPWKNISQVNINQLPERFVLKCTHNSGGVIVCKNKNDLDWTNVEKVYRREIKNNYFYSAREWPYKNVKPQIIAEQYVEDTISGELPDYKFYCFNGKPVYCQVIRGRHSKETIDFFDMDWKLQEFTGFSQQYKPHSETNILKPYNFDKMKSLAEELSKNIPFVRVDFYEANQKLYIGEMTFYPASGFGAFYPDKWNKCLGDMIKLEIKLNE